MACSQIEALMKIFTFLFMIRFTQGLTTSTGHINGIEGSEITLNCDRAGASAGTLNWNFGSIDNSAIAFVEANGKVTIVPTGDWAGDVYITGTSLVISKLKSPRDDGTFYCSLGTDFVRAVVNVLVPVKTVTISPTNPDLSTSSRAQFTCTVTSKPEASITWQLVMSDGSTTTTLTPESGISSPDGKLTKVVSTVMYNPERGHDGGHITCQAQNTVMSVHLTSSVSLTVRYPPILEPEQTEVQSVTVVEKASLVLMCTSWANPRTDLIWKHGTEDLSQGIVNTDKDNDRRESTLTISDIKMDNAGLYYCSASNDLGTAHNSGFNVTVQMWVASDETGDNIAAIAAGVAVPLVLIIVAIVVFFIIRSRRKRHEKTTKVAEPVVYGNNFIHMTSVDDRPMTSDPDGGYAAVTIGGGAVPMQQDGTRDGSPGTKHKASVLGIENGKMKNGTEDARQNLIAQNKVPLNKEGLVYADLTHDHDLSKFPPPKPVRLGEQRGTEYASIDINQSTKPVAT